MTKKKGGLSRGLGAFIDDRDKVNEILGADNKDAIEQISLDIIKPNENQPRKDFKDDSLKELSESIKEYGVISPIILRKIEDDYYSYEIVAGERRYRASKLAEKSTIPAIIREFKDYEKDSISLIENIQREDLNPYEEAVAYKNIMEKYSLTQQELSKAVGKSRPYISNSIRILKLDGRVLEMVRKGDISFSMGRELLSIEDNDKQYKKALEVLNKNLSVSKVNKSKKPRKTREKDFYLIDVEENFMDRLGTKVAINDSSKKITIDYYDYEDLQRIIEIIMGE